MSKPFLGRPLEEVAELVSVEQVKKIEVGVGATMTVIERIREV